MQTTCGICKKEKPNYTCPKCNILYCSAQCYRAGEHQKCSEDFYRTCVEEELKGQGQESIAKQRMQEILERLYKEEENLDSDDSSDTESLSERLAGVDLESSDEVWARLSAKEREEFKHLLETAGNFNEIIPDWEPWWHSNSSKDDIHPHMPNICEDIPLLSTVMKKKPSEAVAYGLTNIIFGYAVIARKFSQDWALDAKKAVETLLDIAYSLSKNKVYESSLEALNDGKSMACDLKVLSTEQSVQAESDTTAIMKSKMFLLAAVSDIKLLFDIASKVEPSLKRKHYNVMKKIEFYLSFLTEYGETVTLS